MLNRIEPHTSAWFNARLGSWTASRAPALMGRSAKGEPLAPHHDLIGEIATERLTGIPVSHFTTPAMQRGVALEPEAADAYAVDRMVSLGDSALVMHPTIPRVCATPDRFCGDDGLVEIKCPTVQLKHLDTFINGRKSLVHEYRDQCLWQLWCTGRQWVDLVSYHPGFPPEKQLAAVRIKRDEERFAEFEAAVTEAEGKVEEILSQLEELTMGQRAEA